MRRNSSHWIIPAYAGSTPWTSFAPSPYADHPRIRGEHRRTSGWTPARLGSSPHTRGAPARGAWVGVCRADHPRIRGEHFAIALFAATHQRIIPAYAGSTLAPSCGAVSKRDHPRIRGEHRGLWVEVPSTGGSSPHTRGAHGGGGAVGDGVRIIPAYAGSTGPGVFDPPRGRDHPRIRGEHVIPSRNVNGVTGSSPHTRGAHRPARSRGHHKRIIPAYAGSTSGPDRTEPGKHGSSPHTRGAPPGVNLRGVSFRIIPAYAGST